MEGFSTDSPFEFNGEKIPSFGIKLTAEQAKLVEHRKPDLLVIDGKAIFKIRDDDGKHTGEYILYVIFTK